MRASFPPFTRTAECEPKVEAMPVAELSPEAVAELMDAGWCERDASGI